MILKISNVTLDFPRSCLSFLACCGPPDGHRYLRAHTLSFDVVMTDH